MLPTSGIGERPAATEVDSALRAATYRSYASRVLSSAGTRNAMTTTGDDQYRPPRLPPANPKSTN
jgi:hypothetical protein